VRLAWAVALAATIASVVGILILTSDQALSAEARTTLGTLGDQLVTLASVLDSADPPLDSVVTATRDTNTAAAHAQQPVDHIAATLDRANTNARDLGPKLDESLTRARTIESKLRVLLLVPIGTR
jgi:hypothetical protein